jgi:hypothetical protein
VVILPLEHVRRSDLLPSEDQWGQQFGLQMLPGRSRRVGVKMYQLSTAGSNRLGGLDPQPLAVDLGRRLLLGRGDVVLQPSKVRLARSAAARSGAPRRVKNCGQPQPQAEATSDVSAR